MGGYLNLSHAGAYCTGKPSSPATARWARRRLLPFLPHYEIPGSATVLAKADIDAWMAQHRREPVDTQGTKAVAELLDDLLGPDERRKRK